MNVSFLKRNSLTGFILFSQRNTQLTFAAFGVASSSPQEEKIKNTGSSAIRVRRLLLIFGISLRQSSSAFIPRSQALALGGHPTMWDGKAHMTGPYRSPTALSSEMRTFRYSSLEATGPRTRGPPYDVGWESPHGGIMSFANRVFKRDMDLLVAGLTNVQGGDILIPLCGT